MTLLKFTATLVFLLTSLILQAQLSIGEEYLAQGRLDEAYAAFEKENGKEEDRLQAYFGMAKILADPSFEGYDLDSAYHYVNQARRMVSRLSDGKQKRLDKNNVGGRAMSRLRNAVADSALASIRKDPSLEAYDRFLDYYQRCRRTTKEAALEAALVLAAEKTAQTKDLAELTGLYERYGRDMRSKYRKGYAELETRLFEAFIREKGWGQFDEFSSQFSNNIFVLDRARTAFLRIRRSANINYYNNFLQNYPSSVYAPMVRDSLEIFQVRKEQSTRKVEELITALPSITDPEQLKRIDGQISTRFEAFMSVPELEKKLEGVQLEYLPKTMDAVYQFYKIGSSVASLKKFKEKYPNYHQISQVDADIIQMELFASGASKKMKENDETIKVYAPRYEAFMALQEIIAEDVKNEDWEKALAKVKGYATYFKDDDTMVQRLISTLEAPAPEVSLRKLGGPGVNSGDSEYTPVLSADGRSLYFCRKKGNFYLSRAKEDIYFASLENGSWSEAEQVQDFDMSDAFYAPVSLTTDGNRMLIFNGGKLSFTDKTKDGWSEVQDFPSSINATAWQGVATVASNGRVIIFEARYRKDALPSRINNQIDLFVAMQNDKGEWDRVFNIGENINTPFDERSPFLHPDMRTLYFSSMGHGGLGGLDVFKTTRLDDSWTSWSEPEHLGKIINTPTDDWGYKISTNGEMAYFSVAPEFTGNSDIYQVVLPETLRPELVSTITLTVKDKDGNPVEADVILEDLSTGEIIGQLRTDPLTGRFFTVLPHEGRYSYVITKEGYFPRSNHVDLIEKGDKLEIDEVIELQKIDEMIGEETTIRLNNLFFDLDKYVIRSESYPELKRMANIIKENDLRIEIQGHTDNTGSPEYNKELSEKRANAVKEYLVAQGLEAAKISIQGLGETQPVASNDTEEGRAQNRRVEIKFVK
jgi:outer membrane protein OmpA-like peptidoglycan-associated protein